MYRIVLFLSFLLQTGKCVIYRLNDTEYARMPPLFDLDKYDSCLWELNGKYCYAKLEIFSEPPNELHNLIKEYSEFSIRHYNHSLIERGYCITKRCKALAENYDLEKEEDLSKVLALCANQTFLQDYGLQANVLEHYCDKHNEVPQKDIYDYLVLYLIYGLFALNIAGTVCESIVKRQNHEKNGNYGFKYYLMCFSLSSNWKWLTSAEPEELRLKKLKSLHGVKCIVMYMFIVGHVLYLFHGWTENPHKFEQYYDYLWYKIVFNGLIMIQMMLTISGFLLSYLLLLESEKRDINWSMVPKIIFLRLWRITPANVVYVLFSATLMRHWNSGPIWKMFVTNRMSGDCRRYWWAHLIYINNYIPDDRYCVVQNWSLAVDVQLFIVGLCVFAATKANRRVVVLTALVILGMFAKAYHIWKDDLDSFIILSPEVYRTFNTPNYVIHKMAHNNLPGFFIGMLTGHFAYTWQKEQRDIELSKFKPLLNILCHFVIPSIMAVFFTGSYFYRDAERASLLFRVLYGMALVPVIAALTSFIIFGMIFRFSDFWVNFLEWDGWVVPGKLTYCISLIHLFFVINLYGSRTQLLHLSSLNHSIAHLGIAAISLIFSIPYCLMIEAPFNRLVKALMSKNVQQVKKVE